MVVLPVLFTALASGMATISDIDSGVLDRFLTSPIRRSNILLGRVAADAITGLGRGVAGVRRAAQWVGARRGGRVVRNTWS
jgi:ABC-type Na+ efflux pump permease subunit